MKTRHEILMEDPEYRKLYAIEGLVTDAAELVARLMEEQGLNRAELARRLGKSRAWITQLLSGKANMTIRTFAEVVYALGAQVKLVTQTAPNDLRLCGGQRTRRKMMRAGREDFRKFLASLPRMGDSTALIREDRERGHR